MVNQRRKNKVFKAKQASTTNKASNNKVQAWKLEVGRKSSARQRNEVDSQLLLKYFLIGIGFVVLGFWLGIISVYFMNNPTFPLERSDLHSAGQQEVTHKKEPASDVEQKQTRSERECVTKGKRLAEGNALIDANISTEKINEKTPGSDSIGIMVKKMQINIGKEKNTVSIPNRKKRQKKYTNLKREASFIWGIETPKENLKTENIGNVQRKPNKAMIKNGPKKRIKNGINILVAKKERKKLHRLSKKKLTKKYNEILDDKLFLATDKMESKTNVEKGKNKKSPEEYCLRSPSDKDLFSKVSLVSEPIILKLKLHSKKLASNINHENVLKKKSKKQNKTKLSQEISTEGKLKDKKKSKEMKNKRNESNSQNDYLQSEIRNFKSTIQNMFVPKMILADRRGIPPIELMPQKPNNSSVKVFMFEGFLSEDECDNLRRVHDMHVHLMSKEDPILCFDSVKTLRLHLKSAGKGHIKVSLLDFTKDTACVNKTFSSQLKKWLKANWSYSTAFYPGENYFSKIYEQRVKQAMGLNPENGGKFQITSYPIGIGYKKHTDCIENSADRRDRTATVLVYLATVKKGGETRFPELGISVRPRKGRALVWNNMDQDGNCESISAHVADTVTNGHKYILQRWYYYQSFYSLGKRPPRTEKPKRKDGQARVSCDEYAYGSCRWYDEWNHDHLIQYHQNKVIKI